MALTHLILVLLGATLSVTFFSGSEAGDVGVCYGMKGNDLIKPPAVVQLLKNNGIKAVRIYDADAGALNALANTGIKVGVSLPNDELVSAATNPSYAQQWVQRNVQPYPDTMIDSVSVGNEVFHQVPQLTRQLLPAMRNIQAALASANLADTVKVITPIALDALKVPSFPPSLGEFRDDLAKSVMIPMLDFLDQTGSYLAFNIYPYFAYKADPKIDLDFVLFRPNNGQPDQAAGLTYYNLFDAMVDAVFHAVEKLGDSQSLDDSRGRKLAGRRHSSRMHVPESGHPHGKGNIGGFFKPDSVDEATQENARTYNANLISKVLRGGGTPYNPDADISVYIFSLFNENLKPGDDDERNFGLFYPNGSPVYKVYFNHSAPPSPAPGPVRASWCTANAAIGEKKLQAALDYACGHGADCDAIQPGKPCYQPNTLVAHASYAFNSYYQIMRRATGSCDFSGAGSIVYLQPDTCDGNAASWCVAKQSAGDSRLQAALDYACGHGADCRAIQAGGRCFNPNTKLAHASYAFNDYYQGHGRSDQSCDFSGCGTVVHQQPSGNFGNCL